MTAKHTFTTTTTTTAILITSYSLAKFVAVNTECKRSVNGYNGTSFNDHGVLEGGHIAFLKR